VPYFRPFPVHTQLSPSTYAEHNYLEKQFVQTLEFIRTVYTGKCRKTNSMYLWKVADYNEAIRSIAFKIAYGQKKCKLDFTEAAAVERELSKTLFAVAEDHSAVT
jgi:hypothetical protein